MMITPFSFNFETVLGSIPSSVIMQSTDEKSQIVTNATEENFGIYSALLSELIAARAKKSYTEKALRKAVDPDGYLSPKGWKLLIEKACADGKIASMEKAKKRGKSDKVFFLP